MLRYDSPGKGPRGGAVHMTRYGYCSECQENVWLTAEEGCPQGHGPQCISNQTDFNAEETAAPATGAGVDMATKVGTTIGKGLGGTRKLIRKFPIAAVLVVALFALFWGVASGGDNSEALTTNLEQAHNRISMLESRVEVLSSDLDSEESQNARLKKELEEATIVACVPEIDTADVEDARTELEAAGYKVVVREQESDKPEGTVLSCAPKVGAELEEGETVTIVVAIAPPVVPTPAPAPSAVPSGDSESAASPAPAPEPAEATVYITDTGSKYHSSGCRYLSKSKHAISLSSAKSQGYGPCSVCGPPS